MWLYYTQTKKLTCIRLFQRGAMHCLSTDAGFRGSSRDLQPGKIDYWKHSACIELLTRRSVPRIVTHAIAPRNKCPRATGYPMARNHLQDQTQFQGTYIDAGLPFGSKIVVMDKRIDCCGSVGSGRLNAAKCRFNGRG